MDVADVLLGLLVLGFAITGVGVLAGAMLIVYAGAAVMYHGVFGGLVLRFA